MSGEIAIINENLFVTSSLIQPCPFFTPKMFLFCHNNIKTTTATNNRKNNSGNNNNNEQECDLIWSLARLFKFLRIKANNWFAAVVVVPVAVAIVVVAVVVVLVEPPFWCSSNFKDSCKDSKCTKMLKRQTESNVDIITYSSLKQVCLICYDQILWNIEFNFNSKCSTLCTGFLSYLSTCFFFFL